MSNTPLPSSFDGNNDFYEENRWEKFSRRLKEEPLIPLGCVLTCMALFGASRSIRSGDHNRTNRMFRARIYAQGFTLVAMIAGSMYWQTDRQKRKEFDKVVEERKAREKNEAWIRELEARDEEEKDIKRYREARRRGVSVDVVRREDEIKEARNKKEREEKKVNVLEKIAEKGAGSVEEVQKEATSKGVLESVQEMVWGGKK
ncbi:Hypoxia induced protein conserved region domain containing protein [Hyaloscypha variabilis]